MLSINNCSAGEIKLFRDRIQEDVSTCAHVQAAAQRYARLLYEEFKDAAVLVRLFVTLPYQDLPARDKTFVAGLARAENLSALLNDKTRVLSLLGTAGTQPQWNDRYQSQSHLGIPLLTANFVKSIPMVSRLMNDMGIDLAWFDELDQEIVIKSLGHTAGVFYVRDAVTRLDQQQRKVVSAQDFVAAHKIKTVFGLGGSYLNGSFVTIIIFTRETIEQDRVERLTPLVNTFKVATMSKLMRGAIFA